MSVKIDWDWRTWLHRELTCTKCNQVIRSMKVVRMKGLPYCWKCWKKMNEGY